MQYNLYGYCSGNPILYTDPSGHGKLKKIWNKAKKVVRNTIQAGHEYIKNLGVKTTEIGAALLGMNKDSKGIYHASFNGWQQYFGYNDFYDFMFDIGTSMKTEKFEFIYNKTSYVLWLWKGDYINLGAGAEMGIYYGGGPHWKVNKKLAMDMSMNLKYKGKTIIKYSKKTWWITGFNPNYSKVKASDLKVTFSTCFNNDEMFDVFRKKYYSWKSNVKKSKVSYTF